jgi:hypothetical protein
VNLAEVDAGVRRTIAAYTQALDDGRVDDLVATFCTDGSVDLPGLGEHEGHDALRAAYGKWVPRQPQRHLIVNTLVTEWDAEGASATSDFVFLLKGDDGWAVQVVGRYEDELCRRDGRWTFHRRTATFS